MMINRILTIAWRELRATLRGTGQFYAGYLWMLLPTRGAIHMRVITSLVYLVPLVFLFGHAWFPGPVKVLGAVAMMAAVSLVAREFVRQARRANYETRPAVRGAMLGLFPFFVVSVVALVWGLMQIVPQTPGNPWMVNLNSSFPEAFAPGPSAWHYDPSMTLTEPNESGHTVTGNGWAFWAYGIQVTLGVPVHWIFEKVAAVVGVNLAVPRLWAWNEPMMALEFLLQLISATMFVGILLDIGLTVQNKIVLGEDIGADLAENFGHTLLGATRELAPDDLARLIHADEGLRQIRSRSFGYLRQHLASLDAAERVRAARALGEWHDAHMAGPLLAATLRNDSDAAVRAAAADGLGSLAATTGLDELVGVLLRETDPEVIEAARGSLRAWAPPAALPLLVDAMQHAPLERSAQVAGAMADIIDSAHLHASHLPDVVTTLLTAPKDATRTGLFLALAALCDLTASHSDDVPASVRDAMRQPLLDALEAAQRELKRAAKDDDLETEIRAATFVGAAGSWLERDPGTPDTDKLRARLADLLLDTLEHIRSGENDHGERLRIALLTALGRLAGEKARSALVKHLRLDPPAVAMAAVSALGSTHDPAAVVPLSELLNDTRNGTSWSALHDAASTSLGRIGDSTARTVLEEHVDHAAAIRALGAIGSPDALLPLLAVFRSEHLDAARRREALLAIATIVADARRDEVTHESLGPARDHLLHELEHAPLEVADAASQAVAMALGKDAVPALRVALKGRSGRPMAIAQGLAAVRDPEVLTALASDLPDTDLGVQAIIVGALSQLEPGAITDELMGHLQHSLMQLGGGGMKLLALAGKQLGAGLSGVRGGAAMPLRALSRLTRRREG
ncbi:MAG: HEAT repeat domain-containing protein [Planctomycetota bacterium]